MEEKLGQEPSNLIKIVLFGPESTGKTTLAKQLAHHYHTTWVPEYAREYLQKKWDTEQKICEWEDLVPIAKGQIASENDLAKQAHKVLVCDTDLLETKVYSEAYFEGRCPPLLEKYALQNTYDLYLLTGIDVPWEADDLRDRPDQRAQMLHLFRTALEENHRTFIILEGSEKKRFNKAVTEINKLLTMTDFTQKDHAQLKSKGISKEKVAQQIATFKEGIPFVNLKKPAVVGDGIIQLSAEEQQQRTSYFEEKGQDLTLLKFVPASGAASRMFKALFNFVEAYDPTTEPFEQYVERTGDMAAKKFVDGMERLPFHELLMSRIVDRDLSTIGKKAHAFIAEMLSEKGLNYGFYPKGLLPFHNYDGASATPFEEHLKEAALYAKSAGSAHLHFTISPQHNLMFADEEERVVPQISKKTTTEFEISYSNQKQATDTIAVNLDNTPFRNGDGSILFRPGGHGALIENLNDQNADIVFIKNIDNVVVEKNLEAVANSKKMLAGLLLGVQSKAFEHAAALEKPQIDKKTLGDIAGFVQSKLNVRLPANYDSLSQAEQQEFLKTRINRPIRVCGMVKNEGEPGGGPFWVEDADYNISLQIIESAQINMEDREQAAVLKSATHFNPVDLVCGIKDHKGEKYDLLQFVDEKQGFITSKTKEGKELKALELPGLWNGAMAYWNTLFVEVPLVTFNPVKTVNDLLKPSHQV